MRRYICTNLIIIKKMCIIFFIMVCFLTACSPPPHMIKRGRILYGGIRKKIIRTAERYIGVKYRGGGSTPFGFDCSGFVMYVYKKNGINIPRRAVSQFYGGRRINVNLAKPGDLLFFKISEKKISHVAIYTGDWRFIHAPSKNKRVSYDSIRSPYWSKRFFGAVTYIH